MTSCVFAFVIIIVTMLLAGHSSKGDDPNCQYNYSYRGDTSGTFQSPGFPSVYPSLLRCVYRFIASPNGGVFLKFDAFDLETKTKGAKEYDYVDVYMIDDRGIRTRHHRFCDVKLPHELTSPLPVMELEFITDHWQNSATGFHGAYRFFGNDRHSSDRNPRLCEDVQTSGLSGTIASPQYPSPYPPLVNCSWIISVPQGMQIILRLEHLDLGAVDKIGTDLLMYNGYASRSTVTTKNWSGQLANYDLKEQQYVTNTHRIVVRFTSGPAKDKDEDEAALQHQGFQMSWMAVNVVRGNASCHGFLCERLHQCPNCRERYRFCIPKSLVCNRERNCGPFDDSDERKCPKDILIVAACIAGPSLLFVVVIILVIYCYKSKHVQKSTSQDQPLTNSQSQGTASHDSFASNHHQMILHTSFVDGVGVTSPNAVGAAANHEDPDDIDLQTTRGLFLSEGPTSNNSLRTHKKRPSYHMMQHNYEDGHLVVAQI